MTFVLNFYKKKTNILSPLLFKLFKFFDACLWFGEKNLKLKYFMSLLPQNFVYKYHNNHHHLEDDDNYYV